MRMSKQTEAARVASNMAAPTLPALFTNYTPAPVRSVSTPWEAKPRLVEVKGTANAFVRASWLGNHSIEQCHKLTAVPIDEIVAWYESMLDSKYRAWQLRVMITRRNAAIAAVTHDEAKAYALVRTYSANVIIAKYNVYFDNAVDDYELI